jgi:hypothetical protein
MKRDWQVYQHSPAPTRPKPVLEESTMQNNPNTENTDTQTHEIDMDREDWELAFESLEKNSYQVLKLGFNFAIMRQYLDRQLIKPRPIMEALDDAMTVLFAMTQFHDVGFNLFLKFSEGQLTIEEEQMLNALGVKI